MKGMGNMMKQAQKLQSKMLKMQEELAQKTVESSWVVAKPEEGVWKLDVRYSWRHYLRVDITRSSTHFMNV